MNKKTVKKNICPIKDCDRPTHKKSKYCIFHASAEEKTEDEFKERLKKYIQEIKEEDKDYNFGKFIFIGDINFKEDLNVTTFKKADFKWATFKGHTFFGEATFKEDAYFEKATFEGEDYRESILEGDVSEVTLSGGAYFREATFEGRTFFSEATFKEGAYFREATFEGHTFFSEAIFKEDAYFEKATFERDACFELICLFTRLILSEAKVFYGKKLSINVINGEGKISFKRAYLENTYLDIDLVDGIAIDFTDTLLRNIKINKEKIENHIIQEREKKFTKAKEIYLLLKNNFHSIGQYEDESWAFGKEKEMERKSNFHFKALHKWLWSCFLNIIYGYGEKPLNVIFSAGILIFIFALLFTFIGIGNPEIIELKGIAIHQNSGNIFDLASKGLLKNNVIRNFSDSLYFSLITFTTLGYGDFRPLEGWGRILAGSETFIGAFMMALFVYTFARRTGGR